MNGSQITKVAKKLAAVKIKISFLVLTKEIITKIISLC